jgi:DNA primase
MTIPPRFLDEIRSRLSLSDIIGKRVKVTRAGREFKACCPFHKEKTPSFTINDDKQFYHCFGCGAHGDVIGFTMRHDNLSFIEAIEVLAAQAGLKVPEQTPQDVEQAKQQKNLYSLVDDAAKWFEEQLYKPAHKDALDYLLKRGLSQETMNAFRVGFAPADGQAIRKALQAQGYTDAQMIEAGILKKGEKKDPYAFFRERVMFPVTDRRGRVVAFGGRIMPDHLRAPDRGDFTPPKYINSSDTPLFHKSRVLYGESHARQAAIDGQPVIVVEGYMDVIACFQAGFRGAVAPMGTALTEEQILSLWKMITAREKTPILSFDGDNAGRRAAERAAARILPLLAPDQSARFSFLPEGEDPDSLLKAGGRASLQKILDGAMSLFDFIWSVHTAGRKFETPEARAGVIRDLQNEIKGIADRDVQRHYNELIQRRINENFFTRPPRAFGGKKQNNKTPSVPLRSPVFRAGDIYPRVLLAAVLNHPHIFDQVEELFSGFEIGNPTLAQVRGAALSVLQEHTGLDRAGLHNHLKQAGLERETGDILCESVYVHAAFTRPGAVAEEVAAQWLEYWQAVEGRAARKEIGSGWKSAFHSSNEDEEERLRHMVRGHAGDGG